MDKTQTQRTVEIVEVGPRDGFQSIPDFIPTDVKVAIIERLFACGIPNVQITSFVSPKAIPQMRDATEVVQRIGEIADPSRVSALVPNLTGARLAKNAGVREITYVLSVSEQHNLANTRMNVDDSFAELADVMESGMFSRVKLDLATVFGCPYEGDIALSRVLAAIHRAAALGVTEVCLCDTIGSANPVQVRTLLYEVAPRMENVRLRVHFHDTRGLGLLNNWIAYQCGVTVMEGSIAGIGGCPFAPGAAGNTATEDLVYLFQSIGIETGVDLPRLVSTARHVIDVVTPKSVFSHLALIDNVEFLSRLAKNAGVREIGRSSSR